MPKQTVHIPPSTLDFLKQLKQNNNREWFGEHKQAFIEQQAYIETFADALLSEMNVHDMIETPSGKASLQRIYRDTRFSSDKTPYKTHWSGGFRRATRQRRGGYYFHIEPGNSFAGGGFYGPDTEDLKRIREEISYDAQPLRKILNNKAFVTTFGTLEGEQLKTTPKGFDAGNEAIDLLRYKQFILRRQFTDEEVTSHSFLKEVNQTFKQLRPFFDYMSEVLTTDINGLSIL